MGSALKRLQVLAEPFAFTATGSAYFAAKPMTFRTDNRNRTAPRYFLAMALFVVGALLAHSFDNCAVHLGELVRFDQSAPQVLTACPHGVCQSCAPTNQAPPDGCDAVSESAVRVSAPQQFAAPVAIWVATVATIPDVPQLSALSGCLHGLATPPPPLTSVLLRSALPARAPPVSV